jgi:hypothetical protein
VVSSAARRPLPALIALLALLVLTALVWWRVLHRGTGGSAGAACPTPTSTPARVTLPAPASVTVEVLNSTNHSGIAAKARTTLVEDGFAVPSPAGNDTRYHGKVLGVADIRYGPKAEQGALLLRYYLPGARLVANRGSSTTVVVSLGAKYRAIATPSAVQAALAKEHVALASAAPTAPTTPTASPTATC